MRSLHSGRRHVRLVHRRPLLRVRLRLHSVGPVEAGPIYRGVVDDGAVDIGVVNHGGVHVGDRAVIGEMAAFPASTEESHAHISEAVVDAAIEADVGAPVSGMPSVKSAGESPITGSPQKAHSGWKDPGSGHPEVAVGSIGPIAWSPD